VIALVALILCVAAVALSLVARDVAIRAFADRADARARAVQTDEAWRTEIDERVREMSKRVNEHHAALASPRRVRA
jgi:predicted Holliday junction resolvase-like endonuclease